MPLSETKRYVVVLSFYIKMIKRKTLQVSSSKHSIKKDMFFSLGQIEIILVGQGGVRGDGGTLTPWLRAWIVPEICRSSRSLSKMTSQIKSKNWHNLGSRFHFDMQFLKVIILKGVSLNKIRCCSWSVLLLSF